MKMSLTDEQIKSIEVYWRKWEALVMSTKPVNQKQMTKAIKQLYKHSNLDPPEILYVASPDRYYAQAFLVSMPDWLQEQTRSLMRFGGCMLFPYEIVCIVCDSPRIISFNSSKSSDAKRNAYVKFSDSFTVSKNY